MRIRTLLSKLKFGVGLNPQIKKTGNKLKFIPQNYKAVLLISADFELAWAWQYSKPINNSIDLALAKAKQARENIPVIINLCEEFNIPITWATVGHLFLESCNRIDGLAHPELPRLPNFENKFWKFSESDWFDNDPCSDYKNAPEWYGPDLIRMILDSRVSHEIGCHTFSHIDCSDEICSPSILKAELQLCKKLANDQDLELKSFVHPGHTIGNLNTLEMEGFTNFRTDYRNLLGYPKRHTNGLWEFEQTAELVYRKEWSIDYHINRYKTIIRRAIKNNTVCVFWFHPSFDRLIVDKVLPSVFAYIYDNRKEIWVTTHTEYLEWFKNESPEKE